MMFITLEDRTAELEIVVFSRQFEKYSDLLYVGSCVYITGTLSVREEEAPKILLSAALPLIKNSAFKGSEQKRPADIPADTSTNRQGKGGKLYVKVPDTEDEKARSVLGVARAHRGNTALILYCERDKKYLAANGYEISADDITLSELEKIVGKESIVYKD